uniref:Uncharacterized protein n=1 Tax=Pseudomonas phage Ghuch01 TaxID=3138535 RepID=A0AAU6W2T7_9CAUD
MIRQIITTNPCYKTTLLEIGTKDSAIRIEFDDIDLYETTSRGPRWYDLIHEQHHQRLPKPIDPDLVMLYEYLKDSGRVVHLTPNIAFQTIQFLKETN